MALAFQFLGQASASGSFKHMFPTDRQLACLQLPISVLELPPCLLGGVQLKEEAKNSPAPRPSSGGSQQESLGPSTSGRHSSGPSDGGPVAEPKKPNAQKRFRERQKELMSSLERQVAEKQAVFERLEKENNILRMRTSILEKVVMCREEQLGLLSAFNSTCNTYRGATSSCFGGASMHDVASSVPEVEAAAIKALRREDVVQAYKVFLSEVSGHLLRCENCEPGSVAGMNIHNAVLKFGAMMKRVVLLNPALVRTLLSSHMETGAAMSPLEGHWHNVVTALQLTPLQREDVVAVFDLYRGLLTKVYEERKLIMAAMGEGVGLLDVHDGTNTHIGRSDLATEMELTEKLQANLLKEQGASSLLCCFMFGKVLESVQFAKLALHSWPWFPDALSVVSTVAQQTGYFERLKQQQQPRSI